MQAEDLLAIITVILSHLSRVETRRIGNPDIALSTEIEDPGDAVDIGSSCKVGGKGGTHHLLKAEALSLGQSRKGTEECEKKEQPEDFHKRTIILAAG